MTDQELLNTLLASLTERDQRLYTELHAHMEQENERWGRIEPAVAVLVSQAHLPAQCALQAEVNGLKLAEARRNGALAVVGVVGGLVGSAVIGILVKIWR